MTYGIASYQTRQDLGDLAQYVEVEDDSVEIDIVFNGALDESFSVDPEHYREVVDSLFETFEHGEFAGACMPGEGFEVVAYLPEIETIYSREWVSGE